jgi:tripartite-type tricarboxylate transporter receptor subunit TctC
MKRIACISRHAAGTLLLAAATALAAGQDYPQKPVKLIVAGAPGSVMDVIARPLADKMSRQLGQPVVVENKAGGGGIVAMEAAAHSPADGYTLLLAHMGNLVFNPALFDKLSYDPVKDFAPVSTVVGGPIALAVQPTLPMVSLADLVRVAKTSPGKLSYGAPAISSPPHLFMELFKANAGVDILNVPHSGGQVVARFLGGDVDLIVEGAASLLPHIKSGRMRPLAITGSERSALLPQVPTFAEQGIAGLESTGWIALLAPAGTPRHVIDRVNRALAVALDGPELKAMYAATGRTAMAGSPDELAARIRRELPLWTEIIKRAGIKPM